MQAHHQIFKAIYKAALVSFCVYKESIPACTWYLPVFQSLNAEKSKTKKRNHDTEPADFVKLFLNTYSGKPAQEGSKTRSARSAGRSPFPHGPKGSQQALGLQETISGFPHGLMKAGQPVTPGQGRVCREPRAQRPFPKAGQGRAGQRPAQPPQPCVLQQTLSGGREGAGAARSPLARGSQMRGLALTPAAELFLPTNGCGAGAGAGTGAAAPRPARRAQPGWRGPGGSGGPARNSGTIHTAGAFLHTEPPRVSPPSESTEKSIKSLSRVKPESSGLNDQSFLPW